MKEGASGFLTKPVQEDQLLSTIESLIGSEAERGTLVVETPLRQK
jgi:FixJ family two-component response regulator